MLFSSGMYIQVHFSLSTFKVFCVFMVYKALQKDIQRTVCITEFFKFTQSDRQCDTGYFQALTFSYGCHWITTGTFGRVHPS